MRLLCFAIDDQRFGISTDSVSEIVRAVAVTPLPGAPAVVQGVIDVRGAILPVFDLRQRFMLQSRPVKPEDQFILATTSTRRAALHVDHVIELVDIADESVSSLERQVQSNAPIAGVATLPDGLILIHDVETFLSRAESDSLDGALTAHAHGAAAADRPRPA
jgi:purine-binding chemotaxis protein CheW